MEFDLGMQIPGLSESQTHRIVGAGRDLGRSPSPAPCSEQGQVARGCVEPGFAHPWGWGPHSRFQCPLPVLFHWIPPRYHWVTKVAVSVLETLGTDSVKTNKICDPHQLAFSPLIQSGQEGFRHIWGWSRGVALRQCVLASRPSAVLEAEWVPHRYFHSLLPSWERTSKWSPSQQPSSCKAILAPVSLPWCQRLRLGAVSACSFSIKCATPTRLCHTAVSPERWRHRKVSSALATCGSIACT